MMEVGRMLHWIITALHYFIIEKKLKIPNKSVTLLVDEFSSVYQKRHLLVLRLAGTTCKYVTVIIETEYEICI